MHGTTPSQTLLADLVCHAAAAFERTADVLRLLAEVDCTDAWAEKPYGSLFAYCLGELNWSEGEAAKKIQACRAGRRFPLLLDRLRAGRLHLSGLVLLASKLTDDSARELIDAASGKSKRDIEGLLAARFPKPDVAPSIRKIPASPAPVVPTTPLFTTSATAPAPRAEPSAMAPTHPRPSATPAASGPSDRGAVAPLSAERHKLTVTISATTRDCLSRIEALTSHRRPEARSLESLLDAALELLEAKLLKERFGVGAKPKRGSKTKLSASRTAARRVGPARVEAIPVATTEVERAPATEMRPNVAARAFSRGDRRIIVARDGLQCSHVDRDTGARCGETRWLTLDHIEPWAHGGPTIADNGRVLCGAHNRAAARRVLGEELVRERMRARTGGMEAAE